MADTTEGTLHLHVLLLVPFNRRMEIKRDVKLTDISVKALKKIVLDTACLSAENVYVAYAGRVLCDSKSIRDYNIKNGVTLFVTRRKRSDCDNQEPFQPDFRDLLEDHRVLETVRLIVNSGTLLEYVVPHLTAELSDQVLQLMASQTPLRDAESTSRLFNEYPALMTMGQSLLDQYASQQPRLSAPRTRERFISRLEGALPLFCDRFDGPPESEEDSEEEQGSNSEEEMMDQMAESQQQMIDESQALQAHRNQQQQQPSGQQPLPTQPPQAADQTSGQTPSGQTPSGSQTAGASGRQAAISQEQLSAALSSLGGVLPSGQASQLGGTQPPGQPTSSTSGGSSQGVLSQDLLSQALANAMATQPGPSHQRPASQAVRSSAATQDKRKLYKDQLSQLRSMGIRDEVTCLHALEATKGNLEAALEILMGAM